MYDTKIQNKNNHASFVNGKQQWYSYIHHAPVTTLSCLSPPPLPCNETKCLCVKNVQGNKTSSENSYELLP